MIVLMLVESNRSSIEQIMSGLGASVSLATSAQATDIVAGLSWIPLILTVFFDLVAGTQVNAAILEYNGMARAAVARARGGVQGDISNLPDADKEAIFSVLEGWELKSFKDNFALLGREMTLVIASLTPWIAALVPNLFGLTLWRAGAVPQLIVFILLKCGILFYWLYVNLGTRSVRIRLFELE